MSNTTPTKNETSRIAICNQKGGCGKSTLTANIGGALTQLGNNVLIIDADPQGHLTSGVGLDDYYESQPPSLYDALVHPRDFDPEDGQHTVDDIIITEHPEFDVIPSNIDMFSLEQDLVTTMRGRERLSQILTHIHNYDYILIDTPPSLGHITDNVLIATQNLIIPVEAEDTSIRALELLNDQIDTLEYEYDVHVREQAVIANKVSYPLDKEQQAMMNWYRDTFSGICPVFEIRERVSIKRAWNNGVSIFQHNEECDQEPVFIEAAKALTQHQTELIEGTNNE